MNVRVLDEEEASPHYSLGDSPWKEDSRYTPSASSCHMVRERIVTPRIQKRATAQPEELQVVYATGSGKTEALVHRLLFGKRNRYWQPANASYEYALWQLQQISDKAHALGAGEPSAAAKVRMVHGLRSLLGPEMLYPTISVDEDGDLTAEWRVLDFGLEYVTTTDSAYWVLRKDGERQTLMESISVLRSVLSSLTDLANTANPAWRSLFPKADVQNR